MRRRTFTAAAVGLGAIQAHALMAGAAPDTPLRRLDANRADSPYACVASLMGGAVYSAVCIAPGFALTAAHTVAHWQDLHVYLNLGQDLSHRFAIKRVVLAPHPAHSEPAMPVGDLALIEIDGRWPEGLALPPLARTPAREGLRIDLAGYGASGFGDRGALIGGNAALKRVGANRIDKLLRSADAQAMPLLYFFTFDAASPARQDIGRSLGNGIEAGLANGDSGSPAFIRENGRLALLGINTFVMRSGAASAPLNGFGTVGGGQAVAAYKPWLRSVLGHALWPGLD